MTNENQELASGASGCAQRGEVESEKSRAAIAAHIERQAQAVRIPQSADEVIAFIGSQFESREDADNPENVRFQLTVHDLQSAFRWWFDTDFAAPSAAAPAAPTEPTEIAAMLRKRASQPMANQDDAKLMLTAADECDRFYGGMMAWKSTAEKKDRDWNAERMARVNERCVARAAEHAQQAERDMQDDDASEGLQLLDDLIANIEKGGNYSKGTTLTFLGQIRQCFAVPASQEGAHTTPSDSDLLDFLDQWVKENGEAGYHWFTFAFNEKASAREQIAAEMALKTPACAQNAEAIRNQAMAEGLEMAARHLDKQRKAVDQDHAYQEPDTGAWVFDRPETEEYSDTLAELADEIRAIKVQTGSANTQEGGAA